MHSSVTEQRCYKPFLEHESICESRELMGCTISIRSVLAQGYGETSLTCSGSASEKRLSYISVYLLSQLLKSGTTNPFTTKGPSSSKGLSKSSHVRHRRTTLSQRRRRHSSRTKQVFMACNSQEVSSLTCPSYRPRDGVTTLTHLVGSVQLTSFTRVSVLQVSIGSGVAL